MKYGVFIIVAGVFFAGCEKDEAGKEEETQRDNEVWELNDTVEWIHSDRTSVDLDDDNIMDIEVIAEGWHAASGSSSNNARIKMLNPAIGIEFLVDSFYYYYCRDSVWDTTYLIYKISQEICTPGTANYIVHIPYAVVSPIDEPFPVGGFYQGDSVWLYRYHFVSSFFGRFDVDEGDFMGYTPPGYIFYRTPHSGGYNYFSIEFKWRVPYFVLDTVKQLDF